MSLKLKQVAAVLHPTTGKPVLVKRGERGYFPWPFGFPLGAEGADLYNERHGITPAEREAMLAGSMFGWDVPATDPVGYTGAKPYRDTP